VSAYLLTKLRADPTVVPVAQEPGVRSIFNNATR